MVTRSKRKIKKKGIVAIILEVNATSQSLIPCNQRDTFLSKKKRWSISLITIFHASILGLNPDHKHQASKKHQSFVHHH